MTELPYSATITPDPVANYAHLKEPLRSRWIQCIICKQVPAETVYSVHIPAQVQGDRRSSATGAVCCSEECARKWVATYEPHFYTLKEIEERYESTLLPTQETRAVWIHAFRKAGEYPEDTERSGKWLIWLRAENIDRYWREISAAVEQGRLGGAAKVSTAASRQVKQGKPYVICVYTYDHADREDVMRIRQVLRDLGMKREIIYKADEDTHRLRYGSDYTPIYRA